MPRKLPRRRLAKGIYRDCDRIELRVMVEGQTYIEWLPGDTLLDECKRKLKQLHGRAQGQSTKPERETLAADADRYLKLQAHLVSYRSRKAILGHWCDRLGQEYRHRITMQDVLAARVAWLETAAPKTVNHRVSVLHHLYKTLDGRKAETPCDEVKPLPVPRTPIDRVSDATILKVDAELQRRERLATGRRKFDGAKTRARFRVLVSTGRRPSEVARAEPSDVNLEQRVWVVRDGKGGWSPGIYLNDDMLAAWRLFAEADAWGAYSTSSFVKVLRRAGWPAGIRPYSVRHTTWIMAVERGVDMADVQTAAGHKHLATTRIYTGVRNSRMQKVSEAISGRFDGFPDAKF